MKTLDLSIRDSGCNHSLAYIRSVVDKNLQAHSEDKQVFIKL